MAVYVGGDKCRVIYVARNGQQVRVSSVWVGDQQVFPGGFILSVGVSSGVAYTPLREWAVSIGKTYQTITEITVPMEVIGPSLNSLFDGCRALTSVPDMDTGKVTSMQSLFNGCWALTSVPDMDTGKVTNMSSMFYGCSALTTAPAMNTSQVTNMYGMFYNCNALTAIPALDTGKVTNMSSLFNGCRALTAAPALNTSQVTYMDYMFNGCSALESVTLPGMGNAFTTKRTLDMKATKLNATAANALMQSLGTPPPGGNLQLPSTAAGADTSIAASKNWTVTIG